MHVGGAAVGREAWGMDRWRQENKQKQADDLGI